MACFQREIGAETACSRGQKDMMISSDRRFLDTLNGACDAVSDWFQHVAKVNLDKSVAARQVAGHQHGVGGGGLGEEVGGGVREVERGWVEGGGGSERGG